jgi:hypothetical protein
VSQSEVIVEQAAAAWVLKVKKEVGAMQRLFISLLFSIVIAIVVSMLGTGTLAQDALPSKPYSQWSKEDVTKLLNDSPWAKTQAVLVQRKKQMRSVAGQVSADPGTDGAVPTQGQAALGGADDAINYSFTMRLRSALPIRQAILRLVQLDANYDAMQPDQKRALDSQTRELLECKECEDNYVISVGFGSTNSPGVDPIYNWFRGQSVESLKGIVYIQNDRGERRDLAAFIPPRVSGDEAFFLFARNGKDGKLLITPKDKRLLFRMSDANANSVTNFSLDVSRMVVGGRIEL